MYALLFGIFWLISCLPLRLLYGISDLAYVVIYHLMGYRKEVVRSNLSHAFPHKPAQEIEQIMRRFYRSFCDQWIETVKLMTMRPTTLKRRMQGNWDLMQQPELVGKNLYMLSGHMFNWEWANITIALYAQPKPYACVYLPLSSKSFDRLMRHIRARLGVKLISMKGLLSGLKQLAGSPYVLGLAADQNPSVVEVAAWLPFMNREAPFFRGPEQMPRRSKAPVVLLALHKLRRGYYEVTLEKLCDDASQLPETALLKGYVAFLEKQLERQPENWLWSHRRWKHVRKS